MQWTQLYKGFAAFVLAAAVCAVAKMFLIVCSMCSLEVVLADQCVQSGVCIKFISVLCVFTENYACVCVCPQSHNQVDVWNLELEQAGSLQCTLKAHTKQA